MEYKHTKNKNICIWCCS